MTIAIETAIKLLKTLPEPTQNALVEKLRYFVSEAQDDATWKDLFTRSGGFNDAARTVRQDIATGQASDMDFDRL